MFTADFLGHIVNAFDSSPWGTTTGRCVHGSRAVASRRSRALYTEDERRRRDASPWTVVQGVLAPVQFLVFLISLGLVLNYLATGNGLAVATFSIIVKTLTLYTIMVTGSIWEREVFGRYLFAPAFFWEDVVSMAVLALHTAYLAALLTGALSPHDQMLLALSAYVTYVINATQFVLKLRAARLASSRPAPAQGPVMWRQHGGAAMGVSR
jgi:3-vinyl bacteriochlorophyllide hydratase